MNLYYLRIVRIVQAAMVLYTSSLCFAGPMGFKDSVMSMGDFSPNWQEGFINYAYTSRDAVGAEGLHMRSDDKRLSRDAVSLTYTRLLKRWNLPEAQANVWFQGGLGAIKGNDFTGSRTFVSPGVSVDYETTRVYVGGTARLYRAKDLRHDFASIRAGFSFYEADYDEVQPWLIVEARRMKGLSEKTELTPMLRLISKRYFVEAGASNNREGRFNFMYIF